MRLADLALTVLIPATALADPLVSPSLNPDVRQDTLATTICQAGYTKAVRPAQSFTHGVKLRLVHNIGGPDEAVALYELDHVVPLDLGGHPRALDNLRLQLWDEAKRKDRIEVMLQCFVCSGQVSLAEAQRQIIEDWQHAYHRWSTVRCMRDKSDPHPWWRGLFDRLRWVVD